MEEENHATKNIVFVDEHDYEVDGEVDGKVDGEVRRRREKNMMHLRRCQSRAESMRFGEIAYE